MQQQVLVQLWLAVSIALQNASSISALLPSEVSESKHTLDKQPF